MKEIQRTSLLNKIQADHLPDLIAITAPAGFGKSVLARQLLAWCEHPSSQINLHPLQRDKQDLQAACIQHLTLDWAKKAELDLHEIETVADFCRLLEQHLKQPHLLLLDDVHLLRGSPSAEQWLAELLDFLPTHLHIVLVGRELPTLPWSQLLAEQRLLMFNREDLRVTSADLQQVSTQPEAALNVLVEQMEGWITGIRLALNNPDDIADTLSLEDVEAPQVVFNQLVQHTFQSLSPDRQIFLLQTALAEQFDQRLCQEVFGQSAMTAHVQALDKGHFYVTQEANQYRYHALLRAFLQDYARTRYPERLQAWHLQLATWFERQDRQGEAIWHYIQGDEVTVARERAEEIAKEWHITGFWSRLLQIRDWLGAAAGPKLQLMCGMILTDWNRLDESCQLLHEAYQEFEAQTDGMNQCRALLQLASNRFAYGDYQTSLELAERVVHHAASSTALQAWASRVMAWTKLELGLYEAALLDLQAVLLNFTDNERGYGRASVLQDMSSAYLRSGQLELAASALLECLALCRQMKQAKEIALGLNNLAYYYHLQSQYEEAQSALDEAFALIGDQDDRIVALLKWTQADLYRDLGQFDLAQNTYEEGLVLARHHHRIYLNILLNLIRLRCWQEQWQDARHILQEAQEINLPEQAMLSHSLALSDAILSVHDEGLDAHIERIQNHLDALQERQSWLALVQYLGRYLALGVRYQSGNVQADAWRRMQVVPEQLLQAVATDLLHSPDLADGDDQIQIPVLAELYQKLQQAVPENNRQPASVLSATSMQIDLQTLGEDSVLVNMLPIPTQEWTVASAREFFYYLHFYGTKSKAELGLVFWSDHNARQLRNALHTNLKRIRKAIPDLILHDGDAYTIHPVFQIRSDYADFMGFAHRAQLLPYRDVRCADLYRRAYELYQGAFLPNFYSEWVLQMRETAEAQFLEVLKGLASCHCEHQDYLTAIQYLEEGIALSPYDESFYRGLMQCYLQLGQQAQVQASFERLAHILEQDLDLSPSTATWNLLQQAL